MTTKIINSTGWRDPWLAKAVWFCCRAVDYPPGRLLSVKASLAHNTTFTGTAYLEQRKITLKINPLNVYPVLDAKNQKLPDLELVDAVEVFVLVAAHEIAHLERWDRLARDMRRRGERDARLELAVERVARLSLAEFRKDRLSLLARWGDAGPGPSPPESVWRQTCPRCGGSRTLAQRPKSAVCSACFRTFEAGKTAGAVMVIDRVPRDAETRESA